MLTVRNSSYERESLKIFCRVYWTSIYVFCYRERTIGSVGIVCRMCCSSWVDRRFDSSDSCSDYFFYTFFSYYCVNKCWMESYCLVSPWRCQGDTRLCSLALGRESAFHTFLPCETAGIFSPRQHFFAKLHSIHSCFIRPEKFSHHVNVRKRDAR